MGKAMALAVVLILLIFMHGCVTERDITISETEKVLSANADDIDYDGYADIKHYVFRPIVINAQDNLVMQKMVDGGEIESDISVKNLRNLTAQNISDFEVLLFQYDLSRKESESECRQMLNLDGTGRRSCSSPRDCILGCTTTECSKYSQASDTLGLWIYQFSSDTGALESDIKDLRNSAVGLSSASEGDRELLMVKLSGVLDRTIAINSNPIFNYNAFKLCSIARYDNEKITQMLSMLGEYERTAKKYKYAVNVRFAITGKSYTELKIIDSIPAPLTTYISNVSLAQEGSSYDSISSQVSWLPVQLTYMDQQVGYSIESRQEMREDIFDNWPTMKVTTKVFSLSSSPVFTYLMDTSQGVFHAISGFGYYVALSAVLAFWDVAIMLLLLFGRTLFGLINAAQSRIGLRDGLLRSYGEANYYWKEYAMAAAGIAILAYALTYISRPISESELVIDNLVTNLTGDIAGAASVLLFFLSIHLAYALLEDTFKGILSGSRYYENVMDASPKANQLRLSKLKERAKESYAALDKMGSFDIADEKSALDSVPLRKIEDLMKASGSERAVKELLEVYMERMDGLEVKIGEKSKIAETEWPVWKEEISRRTSEKDIVPLSSLASIPSQWRKWAASRFMVENDEVALDGETIRRVDGISEKKTEDVLKKLVNGGSAIGGVLLNKGGIISSLSKKGNHSIESVLAFRIASYAKTLGQKVFSSDCHGIVISGGRNVAVYVKGTEADGMLFATRGNVKEAFAEFEKRLKKG